MKKWYFVLLSVFYFLGCGGVTTNVTTPKQSINEVVFYKGPKAKIAVASFKCKAAKCNGQIGSGVADMLTTALFKTGKFIVVERSSEGLSAVEREYSLNTTTNRPIRNLEGADILVVGAITSFEPKAGGITTGGIVVPKGVPFVGGVKFGKNEAYIAADIRLIDVRTGRVINATTVEGSASKWSIGGLGGGAASSILLGGGLSVYKNTPMEKAIRVMIDNAVKAISKLVPENYYRYDEVGNPVKTVNETKTAQTSNLSAQNTKENYKLLFSENFEKYGIGQTAPFGKWEGDKFPVKVGVQRDGNVGKILETYEDRKICISDLKAKNIIITADWNHNVTIWFRVVSKNPVIAYIASVWDNGEVHLDKIAGDTRMTIAKNRVNLNKTKWHTIKVVANNSHILVYADGEVAVDINDNDKMLQQSGTVCIGGGCCVSKADNLKIYKIEE